MNAEAYRQWMNKCSKTLARDINMVIDENVSFGKAWFIMGASTESNESKNVQRHIVRDIGSKYWKPLIHNGHKCESHLIVIHTWWTL